MLFRSDLSGYMQGVAYYQTGATQNLDETDAALLGDTKGFASFDMSFGVSKNDWTAEFFIQNIFDRRGILTVSSAPSFAARWLVPRLGLFNARHPEIDVRVSATLGLADFARDGVDAAIRYGRGKYPGLHVERLMQDEIFPVCSPALLKRGPRLRKPDDLRHYMLLHDESPIAAPDWTMWLRAAGATKVDPARGLRFSNFDLTLTAALAGEGVALARSSLSGGDIAAGRLVQPFPLRLATDLATYFVCPPGALKSPRVAAFREWLFGEIGREAGKR